jgi:hypothetical protein
MMMMNSEQYLGFGRDSLGNTANGQRKCSRRNAENKRRGAGLNLNKRGEVPLL